MGPGLRYLDALIDGHTIRGRDGLGCKQHCRPHQEDNSHRNVSYRLWTRQHPIAAALPATMEATIYSYLVDHPLGEFLNLSESQFSSFTRSLSCYHL
jgi:hypothetical protein